MSPLKSLIEILGFFVLSGCLQKNLTARYAKIYAKDAKCELFIAFQIEKHLPTIKRSVSINAFFKILPFIFFRYKEKFKIVFLIVMQYIGFVVSINNKKTNIMLKFIVTKLFYKLQ